MDHTNSGTTLTRRGFFSGATTGAILASVGGGCGPRTNSGANSKVNFGIIGTGRRGTHVGALMAADPNAHLAAICDIYPDRISRARESLPGGVSAKVYRDLHDLLASPEIDAVLIATPVFLHPEHFEAAAKARKHIYCEKPVAASVSGVQRMTAAAAAADPTKTIQFGFQQRYSPEYLRAKELLKDGRIGEMRHMMSYWILANMLDGPFASRLPEADERIRRWEFYRETSGCPIVEQDCHGIDAMNWFAGNHPVKAVGTGGLRAPLPWGDWTSDHHNITYFYPGGIQGCLVSIKERHPAAYRDVREQFFGATGVIETARTYYKLFGSGKGSAAKDDDLRDRSLLEQRDSKREITIDAVEVFFRSIVEQKPVSTATAAAESTLSSLLGRTAYETGREVSWEELIGPAAIQAAR